MRYRVSTLTKNDFELDLKFPVMRFETKEDEFLVFRPSNPDILKTISTF